MPLNWEEFDQEAARKAGSTKLNPEERAEIEELAARALVIPPNARSEFWGAALGYGRDAQAIVQLLDGIEHRHTNSPGALIVKLYRTRKPAFSRWHSEQFGRMPGFSGNPRIQQSIAADEVQDWRGKSRSYAVLQHVPGIVLDAWLEMTPKSQTPVRFFLEQIFMEMVIPLWNLGHRGWDLRSGNMVVDPATQQLTMIDTDSYQNTFAEVTGGTSVWTRRDDFENRFFRRGLSRVVNRISQGKQKPVARRNTELQATSLLEASNFLAALHNLGRPNSSRNDVAVARQACAHFLDRLSEAELI
jgi:hypothetical protein